MNYITRTLNAIGDKVRYKYPLAVMVLVDSPYVDNIFLASDDIEELGGTIKQLKISLLSAGFHQHKFASK